MQGKLISGLASLVMAHAPEPIQPIYPRRHVASPDDECVSKSFSIHKLTALAPEILLDTASPDNNAVVFQLFNPITRVSGECTAHGTTLAPDKDTGRPELWYDCFVESRDPSITVQFQYDSALDQLTVNETWICEEDEVDGSFRSVPACLSDVGDKGHCQV